MSSNISRYCLFVAIVYRFQCFNLRWRIHNYHRVVTTNHQTNVLSHRSDMSMTINNYIIVILRWRGNDCMNRHQSRNVKLRNFLRYCCIPLSYGNVSLNHIQCSCRPWVLMGLKVFDVTFMFADLFSTLIPCFATSGILPFHCCHVWWWYRVLINLRSSRKSLFGYPKYYIKMFVSITILRQDLIYEKF